MQKRLSFLLLGIVVALVIIGCSVEQEAPAAPVTSSREVSFVSSRLSPGFSLQIPDSWHYLITDLGLFLSDNAALLGARDDGAVIPSGSLVANVSLLTEADVIAIGARNAASLIDAFVGASSGDVLRPGYRASDSINLEGRDNAQSFVSIGGSDSLLLALELDRNFLLAIVVAPEGELRLHTDALDTVFGSAKLLVAS